MILNDLQILARMRDENMIYPYSTGQHRVAHGKKVISYGLSSFGYDIRLGKHFKLFNGQTTVDPKAFDEKGFTEITTLDPITVPANSFALGVSVEKIQMPRDLLAICLGKSTYARCGILVNVTPLEPEWVGYITIEISNTTPNPARVYPMEGICQLIFHQGDPCGTSYARRGGKYQDQEGVTGPRV